MATSRRRGALTTNKTKAVTFVATGDATVTLVETPTGQTVTIGASAPGGSGITALTGNVTASGSGSVVATIANDAVTYAKMQNVSAADRLLGRGNGGGAGDVQELTIGTGLSLATTVLSAGTLDTIPAPVASVSFNGQQATSFRVENLTADPVSPTVGQIWLRTDL